MGAKEKITTTRIFKLALISSILLFISLFYGQKLWSDLWMIYGFAQIGIILFFIVIAVWGIVFWIRKNGEYEGAFVPLAIMTTCLGLIIILPLNRTRNRLEFSANKRQLEKVVDLVLTDNQKLTKHPTLYKLPAKYEFLSAGGGEVIIINKLTSRGVLFYTFRGVPDGMSGFLKIKGNGKIDDFKTDLDVIELKDLGDGWYFISGE